MDLTFKKLNLVQNRVSLEQEEEQSQVPTDPVKLRNYNLKKALLNFKPPEQETNKNKEQASRSGVWNNNSSKNTEKSQDSNGRSNASITRSSSIDVDKNEQKPQKGQGSKGLLFLDGNMKNLRSSLKFNKDSNGASVSNVEHEDNKQSNKTYINSIFREKSLDNTSKVSDKQSNVAYRDRYEDKQRNTSRLQSPLGQSLRSAQFQFQSDSNSQNNNRSQVKSILRNDSKRSQGSQHETNSEIDSQEQHDVQNKHIVDNVAKTKKSDKQVKFKVLSSKGSSENLSQLQSNQNKTVEIELPQSINLEASRNLGRSRSIPSTDSNNNYKAEILSTHSKQQFDELQAEFSGDSNSNKEGKQNSSNYQLNDKTSTYLNCIIQSSPNVEQLSLLTSQDNIPYRSRSLKDLDQAFSETFQSSLEKEPIHIQRSPQRITDKILEEITEQSVAASDPKVEYDLLQQTDLNQLSYNDEEQQFLAMQNRSTNLTPTKTSSRFVQESSSFSSSVVNLQKRQDSQEIQSFCKSPDLQPNASEQLPSKQSEQKKVEQAEKEILPSYIKLENQGDSVKQNEQAQNDEELFQDQIVNKNLEVDETTKQNQSQEQQQQGGLDQFQQASQGLNTQKTLSIQNNANKLDELLQEVNNSEHDVKNSSQEITTQDLLTSQMGKLQKKYLNNDNQGNNYQDESNETDTQKDNTQEQSNRDSDTQLTFKDVNNSQSTAQVSKEEVFQSFRFWQKERSEAQSTGNLSTSKQDALMSQKEISDFPNKMISLSKKIEQEISDLNKRIEEKQQQDKSSRAKLMLKGLEYYSQNENDKQNKQENKNMENKKEVNTVTQSEIKLKSNKVSESTWQQNPVQFSQSPKQSPNTTPRKSVERLRSAVANSHNQQFLDQSGQSLEELGEISQYEIANNSLIQTTQSSSALMQTKQFEGQNQEGKSPTKKQDFYLIDSYYTFSENTQASNSQYTVHPNRRRGSQNEDLSYSMESKSPTGNQNSFTSPKQGSSQVQQNPEVQQSSVHQQYTSERQLSEKANDNVNELMDTNQKSDKQSSSNKSSSHKLEFGKPKYIYSGPQIIYKHDFDKQNAVMSSNDFFKKTQSSRLDTETSVGGQSVNPTKFLSMFDTQPAYYNTNQEDLNQDSKMTLSSRDQVTQSSRDQKLKSLDRSQVQFNDEPISNYQSFQQHDSQIESYNSSKQESKSYNPTLLLRNNLATNKDSLVFQSGNTAKYLTSSFRDIYNVSQNTMRTGKEHSDSANTAEMEKYLVQKVLTQHGIEPTDQNVNAVVEKQVNIIPPNDTNKLQTQQGIQQNKSDSQFNKENVFQGDKFEDREKIQGFSNQNDNIKEDTKQVQLSPDRKMSSHDMSKQDNEMDTISNVSKHQKANDLLLSSPNSRHNSTEYNSKHNSTEHNSKSNRSLLNNIKLDEMNTQDLSSILFESGNQAPQDQSIDNTEVKRRSIDNNKASQSSAKPTDTKTPEPFSISFFGVKPKNDSKVTNENLQNNRISEDGKPSSPKQNQLQNFINEVTPESISIQNEQANPSLHQPTLTTSQDNEVTGDSSSQQKSETHVPKLNIQHVQSNFQNPALQYYQQSNAQNLLNSLNSRESEIVGDEDEIKQPGNTNQEKQRARLFQRKNKRSKNFNFDEFEQENQNSNQKQNSINPNQQLQSAMQFESLHNIPTEQQEFLDKPYQSFSQQSFRTHQQNKGKNKEQSQQQENRHRAKLAKRLDLLSNTRRSFFRQLQSQDQEELYRAKMKCFKLF